MEKLKYLKFLDYLREKDDVVIDKYIIRRRKYGRADLDLTPLAENVLSVIKGEKTADAAYASAAKAILEYYHIINQEQSRLPDVLYKEDLLEYLSELGVANADKLCDIISHGEYKRFLKGKPADSSWSLNLVDPSLHCWAMAVRFLPARATVAEYFKSEYATFEKEYCQD